MGAFFEKKTRDTRTQEIRKHICELVTQSPGLHLSKIAAMLDMSIQLTDYHLRYLEKRGDIVVIKDERGYFKRYYVAESGVGIREKQVLEVLRKKIPLKIVLYLLQHRALKHKQILQRLEISSSTLSYHLTTLVESGIVEVHPHGKEKGYTLTNRGDIIRILKKHELHIEIHLIIESFKELWEDLKYHEFTD